MLRKTDSGALVAEDAEPIPTAVGLRGLAAPESSSDTGGVTHPPIVARSSPTIETETDDGSSAETAADADGEADADAE